MEPSAVVEALERQAKRLTGRRLSDREGEDFSRACGTLAPGWLVRCLKGYGLTGTSFALEADRDRSGMGVAMKWMTPEQIVGECKETYPGIVAHLLGYLPVGMCLEGSGNYYYLDLREGEDPSLVRLVHDGVIRGENQDVFDRSGVEVVTDRFSRFLGEATPS